MNYLLVAKCMKVARRFLLFSLNNNSHTANRDIYLIYIYIYICIQLTTTSHATLFLSISLSLFLMDRKTKMEAKKLDLVPRRAMARSNKKRCLVVLPVRGRIKRKIFALLYKKLKLTSLHAVRYLLSNNNPNYS